MAVVILFLLTNLPYIVDEFIRQKIFIKEDCSKEWCKIVKVIKALCTACHQTFEAVLGVCIVANSALNPFVFLVFNSKSTLAQRITNFFCPLTRPIQNRCQSFSSHIQPKSTILFYTCLRDWGISGFL